MGNFERNNTMRKEREERDFKVREKLSGFFFDLAKLIFAAMVLVSGIAMIDNEPTRSQVLLFVSGIFFTVIIAMIGYNILKQ